MPKNVLDDEIKLFYRHVGSNVKRLREAKGMSQLELALSLGHTSASFLGKAEIGLEDKHFNLEQIYRIAKLLEVKISDITEND